MSSVIQVFCWWWFHFWSGVTHALSVCRMVQKASASGFALLSAISQVWQRCPDHLQSQGCAVEHIWHRELALKGSRSAGAVLLVFLGSVKEDYTSLVFLDPACAEHFAIRILRWASPSSTASKILQKLSLQVSFSGEILYLISSWVYTYWLFQGVSLFITIQRVWTSLGSKTGHTCNSVSLSWLLSCDLFAFVSNFVLSIPLCINPEFYCRYGYN